MGKSRRHQNCCCQIVRFDSSTVTHGAHKAANPRRISTANVEDGTRVYTAPACTLRVRRRLEMQPAQHALLGGADVIVLHEGHGQAAPGEDVSPKGLGKEAAGVAVLFGRDQPDIRNFQAFDEHFCHFRGSTGDLPEEFVDAAAWRDSADGFDTAF